MKLCLSAVFLNAFLGMTRATTSSTSFDQNFDDLPTIPDEARLSPVGIQNGISYVNFDVAQPGVANETVGIIPHSSPNVALLAASSGNLTVAYSGSTVLSFTLSSFYCGCEVSGEGAANVATTCDVTLTGYKALSNEPIATQSFTFTPSEAVDVMQPLALVTLNSGFQLALQTVVFTVTTPLVSLSIDNVNGTTTS